MFCCDVAFQKDLIGYLEQYVIDLNGVTGGFNQIYEKWKAEFDGSSSSGKPEVKTFFNRELISQKQDVPAGAQLLGIDLPIWFNTPTDKKKIMIVGIDPLRNKGVFKYINASEENDVILGTPYALHLPHIRNGRTKQYWKFIMTLSMDHFLYITDIYKTFFYQDVNCTKRSYDYYQQNKNSNQRELLGKEIKLIEPDIIITLGAKSYRTLTGTEPGKLSRKIEVRDFDGKCKIIPMVHLSGRTRKHTMIEFLENNGVEPVNGDYGTAYFQIVKRLLNSRT